MIDKDEIARRHGIEGLAGELRGETAAELEAFAAAVAALRQREEPAGKHAALIQLLHPPAPAEAEPQGDEGADVDVAAAHADLLLQLLGRQ